MAATKQNQTKPAELIGQVSDEQISTWKASHPLGIYGLKSGGHIGYFKRGDRHEVNAAMAKASTDAALDMYEVYGGMTFIGGSREILENDHLFKGVAQELKKDMDGEKAELVNL